MIYFLDTCICVHILNGNTKCMDKVEEKGIDSVFLPSVVVAELFYGAYKSAKREQNLRKIRGFVHLFKIEGFNNDAVEVYGEIRAILERKGNAIGANDFFISAIAKAHNAILVTNNTRKFSRIPGLTIEDWIE